MKRGDSSDVVYRMRGAAAMMRAHQAASFEASDLELAADELERLRKKAGGGGIIVKPDPSPNADIRQPWNNRNRHDSQVLGAIELAYVRGIAAGRFAERKKRKRK